MSTHILWKVDTHYTSMTGSYNNWKELENCISTWILVCMVAVQLIVMVSPQQPSGIVALANSIPKMSHLVQFSIFNQGCNYEFFTMRQDRARPAPADHKGWVTLNHTHELQISTEATATVAYVNPIVQSVFDLNLQRLKQRSITLITHTQPP